MCGWGWWSASRRNPTGWDFPPRTCPRGKPRPAQAELVKQVRNKRLTLEEVVDFDGGKTNAQGYKQGDNATVHMRMGILKFRTNLVAL
jgi:hypothetical protein